MYIIADWIHLQVILDFLQSDSYLLLTLLCMYFLLIGWTAWIEIRSYLLLGDSHVIPHIRENRGLNEEPFQAQSFASTLQLSSFLDSTLDIF